MGRENGGVVYIFDFDGVFVPNVITHIDFSDESKLDENYVKKEFYTNAMKLTKDDLNAEMIGMVRRIKSEGSNKVYILTGRKSDLKRQTEWLLEDVLNACVDSIIFSPDNRKLDEYLEWKYGEIEKIAKENPGRKIVVYDDDQKMIDFLRKEFKGNSNIKLIRYIYEKRS